MEIKKKELSWRFLSHFQEGGFHPVTKIHAAKERAEPQSARVIGTDCCG
jgi:hypothetical protein